MRPRSSSGRAPSRTTRFRSETTLKECQGIPRNHLSKNKIRCNTLDTPEVNPSSAGISKECPRSSAYQKWAEPISRATVKMLIEKKNCAPKRPNERGNKHGVCFSERLGTIDGATERWNFSPRRVSCDRRKRRGPLMRVH